MERYEVIVEVLGRQYRCEVEATSEMTARDAAEKMMYSKIRAVSANKVQPKPIQEISDFDSIFSQILGGFKPGQR